MKRTFIFISFFYVLLWIVFISSNYKAYGLFVSIFDSEVIKIHANLQVITGPMHYIDDAKGIKVLDETYPELKNYDIELLGTTPYEFVDDPAEIGDLVVYGRFNGTTDRYSLIGYDEVPVFEVKYYDYPSLIFGSNLYILPIYIAVISFPILIIYILIRKRAK